MVVFQETLLVLHVQCIAVCGQIYLLADVCLYLPVQLVDGSLTSGAGIVLVSPLEDLKFFIDLSLQYISENEYSWVTTDFSGKTNYQYLEKWTEGWESVSRTE